MLLINKNKIELIGKITDLSYEKQDINGKRFMFFDIIQKNKEDDNNYSSSFFKIKLKGNLLTKYKDIVKVSNNIYVVGTLNSYIKDKKNIYYIYPTEIELLDENYKSKNNDEIISYNDDGVMLWHGKECKIIPPTKEEKKEMENILSELSRSDENEK